MSNLELLFLGPFQALDGQQAISGFESARVRALLAYLTVEQDHPHSRDALAGLLWPESSDQTARKNLRQALSNLRKAIADNSADPPYLHIRHDMIQFNASSQHRLDVSEFTDLINACDNHCHRRLESCRFCAQRLQRAVDLYRGEFLQGFFLDDSVAFQDWMLLKRERYHRQVVQALTVLTQNYEQRGEYKRAQRNAYLQVEFDPWREEGYQRLMRLLALDGERSAALRQYAICRDILMKELGVKPSQATTRLYEQIKTNQLVTEHTSALLHNLPLPTTSFVGREKEMVALMELLSDPNSRMLTLVGPGGVGKTRLALQAASEAIYDFVDGCYFVSLASVRSGEYLPSVIADALGFVFQGHDDPVDQLVNYLRQKDILLVLDNFEHLLDDLDLVIQILRQAPGVILLVTSREPLGLQAEQLVDVKGLSFPKKVVPLGVSESEALSLFQERAQRLNPEFSANEDNLQSVAGICRLVEGMPLAIELAAALVRQLTCDEIELEIQRSLDLLASSMHDLPERHRSLRATFERSWELLSPREQGIIKQLAIFRGGFEANAVRQIVGAGSTELTSLVDKSLLRRNADGRYDLHPLIRQYLEEKLCQDSHKEAAVLEKLGVYYAGFLQEAEPKLKSSQQAKILDGISQELENIQTAWRCSLKQKKINEIDQSLDALYSFFEGRSRYQEGATFFSAGLDAIEDDKGLVYWRLCVRYGALSYRLGDYERAESLLEQSLGAFQRLDDRREEAFSWYTLGNLAYLRGNFELAVKNYQKSLDISRYLGADYEISQALNGLGLAVYMQGDYPRARVFFTESMEVHQEIGDPWGMAVRKNNLALVACALGEYLEAKELYGKSLIVWKQIRQKYGIASCYNNMGLVSEVLGEYLDARKLYGDALTIFEQLGHRYGIASCMNNMGNVAAALDEYELARELYEKTLAMRKTLGDRRGIASVSINLGRVAGALREWIAAKELYIRALQVGWESKVIPLVLDSLIGLADILVKDGAHAKAVAYLALVIHHPGSNQETIDRASDSLDKLREEDFGDDFDVLVMKSKKQSLDQIVNGILSEYSS